MAILEGSIQYSYSCAEFKQVNNGSNHIDDVARLANLIANVISLSKFKERTNQNK